MIRICTSKKRKVKAFVANFSFSWPSWSCNILQHCCYTRGNLFPTLKIDSGCYIWFLVLLLANWPPSQSSLVFFVCFFDSAAAKICYCWVCVEPVFLSETESSVWPTWKVTREATVPLITRFQLNNLNTTISSFSFLLHCLSWNLIPVCCFCCVTSFNSLLSSLIHSFLPSFLP